MEKVRNKTRDTYVKCSYHGCNETAVYCVEWTEYDRAEEPEVVQSYFSCKSYSHMFEGVEENFEEFGVPSTIWDLLANEDRPDLVNLLNSDLSPA
ncbi:hypothetical protein AUJ62_03115 [Candidatus Pacearchaeota archaeon CG1_02_32_21]|nr:MAG: hypothetical protein AUJ62_03115 [Candidatus Pacearchaeota archaeon CG1_02_32_21]